MAVTMTGDGELLYSSFPIERMETNEDGDIVVYGKASDGGLDSDNQIVDPAWMAKASQEWLGSGGNVRVQHNPQRDPAGVGLEVSTDQAGATWLKGLVIEPVAKRLVSKGALRAYSVGIARPTISRDATAPNGRITAGELVEISLVDRPANKRCGIQLVKSVDGAPEYTGEVFGEDEDIKKALDTADMVNKAVDQVKNGVRSADEMRGDHVFMGKTYEGDKNVTMSVPEDMTLSFTPNDLMRIVQNKFVERHYDELAAKAIADSEFEVTKRDIDTATRRNLAGQGHALPDGSYPIANAEDLHNAAVLARSGHGNVSGARALIARRAKELGVTNPLSDTDDTKIADVIPKEADPALTKDPADGDGPAKPKKGKKGKKLPPWLNKPADGDTDDDGDCKMAHTHSEKCSPSGTPQSASGAKDAADMKEIPNKGPAPESPMPAGRKTPDTKSDNAEIHSSPEMAAMLRFKTIGIDVDLGRLHDLSCPAFHPDEVAKYHPFADFKTLIDNNVWQRKALEAAASKSLTEAMEMQQVWQAANVLKSADPGVLNDIRLDLHKAFRDANPGPTSYPSPGSMSPDKFHRPVISDGHATNSPGYGSPNSSANVASGPVGGAGDFDRPPLSAGHQSPSPSFMKAGFEYPSETGVPTKLTYRHMEKEQALAAIGRLHTHLMAMVPNVCPMDMNSRGPLDPNPAATAVGLGKTDGVEATDVTVTAQNEAVSKAPGEEFSEEFVEKAFKKMRKKLGKKVLGGKMTVDEARSKLGRMNTQKSMEALADQVEKGILTIDEARAQIGLPPYEAEVEKGWYDKGAKAQVKAGVEYINKTYGQPEEVTKGTEPDLMKSINELKDLLTAQQQSFETKIAEQQKVIDAIADAPDPRGEPFSGLARNPVRKSARPAGVPDVAETAERTQQMIMRQLEHTSNTSEIPAEREAARNAIYKLRGITQ